MNKIVQLNEWIISRMGIEQLINSYGDIVKELVDNSIDSGSDNIKIYIDFTQHNIKVVDNGRGMDEEDLKVCTLSHNTSKFTDFSNLKYLGFRGEGLYAIKESSNLEIITRMDNTLYGHYLLANGTIEKTAANKGTTVNVKNIFYKTPRKHIFINRKNEFIHIVNYLQQMALCYPHIKYSLFRNNVYYMSIGQGDNIIQEIFNIENYETFIINHINFNLEIYCNKKPKEKKGKLLFFVNKRPVMDLGVLAQIKKFIEHKVGEKNLVFLLVFLTIDSAYVDVNITPNKNRVKISILEEIKKTIEIFFKNSKVEQDKKLLKDTDKIMNYSGLKSWFAHKNKFIFAQYNDEIYVLDQHAISERILLNTLLEEEYVCQMLLEKISIKLTEEEKLIISDKTHILKSMKFLFYQLDNYLVVYGIPSFLSITQVENTIKEFLKEEDFHVFLHKMSEVACRYSIRGGYKLSERELDFFFSHIMNDTRCAYCNHGRKTHFIIGDKQIIKWLDINNY